MDSESNPLLESDRLPASPVAVSGRRRQTRLYACIYSLFFLDCFSGFLLDVPLLQLLERTICWRGVERHALLLPGGAPVLCRSPAVQREVAIITGFKGAFDSIPALLTAWIYGSLADRIGRRPILLLSFAGLYLHLLWILFVCYQKETLPTRLVWVASVFLVLGGGHKVFVSMLYTMLSDSTSGKISGRIYTLSVIKMLSSTITPLVSGFLMTLNLWTPFKLAIALSSLCFPIILLVPETWTAVPRASWPPDEPACPQEGSTVRDLNEPATVPAAMTAPAVELNRALGHTATYILRLIRKGLSIFSHQSSLSALLAVYLTHSFATSNTLILPQYGAERLQWELHETTKLLSIKYGITLLITSVLVPVVATKMQQGSGITPRFLNLRIARACLCCSTVGYACIATATNPVWFLIGLVCCAIGEGVEPASLTLVALSAPMNVKAKVFVTVGILDTIGVMLGRPAMAAFYSVGLRGDQALLGLPFAVSAFLLSIAVALAFIRVLA
ncbi:major facilitator superfamily domain-containing protein [Xylaria palmicola]|nr:major facilitator superfamily domain-containing protein [Xylaria palmicola]